MGTQVTTASCASGEPALLLDPLCNVFKALARASDAMDGGGEVHS